MWRIVSGRVSPARQAAAASSSGVYAEHSIQHNRWRARVGIITLADPDVLPLGTRIGISGAGAYDGVYIAADTGRRIQGQEIDIYVPSAAEVKKFGEKTVKVAVLAAGEGKEDARQKDRAGRQAKKP